MKFDTEPKNKLEKLFRRIRSLEGWRFRKAVSNADTVLLFIGYPRSGHTLIGSMLDAHPDMVIAHELDALYYFQEGFSINQIFYLIHQNSVSFTRGGRQNEGYSYTIPNQWQGKFRDLKVFGDKCGGRTSHRMKLQGNTDLIHQTNAQLGNKLKLLHVIRNPYDNVSTMMRRTVERKGAKLGEPVLRRQMRFYFDRCQVIQEIKDDGRIPVLDIHLSEFMANPIPGLKRIFDFLEMEAPEAYFQDCASIVWDNPNRSRDKYPQIWTPEMIHLVEEKMAPYEFLTPYSFQSA
ncbi:MAG: hypothetical protein KDC34_05575 [Saprospiraceae bacterium]|nr:hypothetical protein [Saprospiraceae bacterium]